MTAKTRNSGAWLLRMLAAGIMLQTLYFKFTADPESVYIFSAVGTELWGRILVGIRSGRQKLMTWQEGRANASGTSHAP